MSTPRIERRVRQPEARTGSILRDARQERAEDLAELFGFGFTALARVLRLPRRENPESRQTRGSAARSG